MRGFYNRWSGGHDLGSPPLQPVMADGMLLYENIYATEGGDSGIDSSDNEVLRMNRINLENNDEDDETSDSSSSSSSSDESPDECVRKPMLRAPHRAANNNESRNSLRKLDLEDDRHSPPLLEVELTASDDDDDASVLELVIPIPKKYQKVPPLDNWKYTKALICFCCFSPK